MSVIVHVHQRNGRVSTIGAAKAPVRAKARDCAGCGGKCGDRKARDQTPGIDRIQQALADWEEEQRITMTEIAAAQPDARPALQRIMQNQTIRISQLKLELFRLQRDGERIAV